MVRKTTVAGELDRATFYCQDVDAGGVEALQDSLNGVEYAGLALMVQELNGRLGQLMGGDDAERIAWDIAERFVGEPVAHYLLRALDRNRTHVIDAQAAASVPVSLRSVVPPLHRLAERFLDDAIARYQQRMSALGVRELI